MATLAANKYNLKFGFTSAMCPEWTAAAIVDGMKTYGYHGVEFILGKGHLHGVELDTSPEDLQDVRKQFDEAGMAISCLTTSFSFSSPDIADRRKALEGVKNALKIADSMGAPYVRVLGGDIPANLEPVGVIDYVSESLSEVAEFSENEKLRSMALVETAGSFAHGRYLSEVMGQVYSKKLGVLWDVLHPLRVMEKVEDTFDRLGSHIRHVHIRDAEYNDDRTRFQPCEPGEGFVPLDEVIDQLKSSMYRGYLSVDPLHKVEDPDSELPKYAEFLKKIAAGGA